MNRIIPNAVVRSKGDKRIYFGHEVEYCVDYSSLHYRLPFEKVRPISWIQRCEAGINISIATQGYVVDWDAQKAIWDGMFSPEVLGVSFEELESTLWLMARQYQINPTECSLLITEPYFNLPNIQDVYDQFMFEEYEFQSYYRCTRKCLNRYQTNLSVCALPAASVIPYGTLFAQRDLPPAECMLVIDSGFSFTHVVPMIEGRVIWKAVKR